MGHADIYFLNIRKSKQIQTNNPCCLFGLCKSIPIIQGCQECKELSPIGQMTEWRLCFFWWRYRLCNGSL